VIGLRYTKYFASHDSYTRVQAALLGGARDQYETLELPPTDGAIPLSIFWRRVSNVESN
jgi:hypothetical protein